MSRAMRAAVLPAHGAVPEFGDFDDPTPADGQEVLTVLAGGLNPVDIRIAGGNFPSERREPPYVPGKEGIGRREDGTRVLRTGDDGRRDTVRRDRDAIAKTPPRVARCSP